MDLMISMRGDADEVSSLPEIAELGAGIELGGYGLEGVRSDQEWEKCSAQHQALCTHFPGPVALHGPFVGMEFAHLDHLIRTAVRHRLDMTFAIASQLQARRVILHSGCTPEVELFQLEEIWFEGNLTFWQAEIPRWADAGIEIVLENDTQKTPDLLVQLVNAVDNPYLGLCLDIGHQHLFSELAACEWVRRMGQRLRHIHLHDNDRTGDTHWPIGHGTIEFEPFYAVLQEHVPHVTMSLEVNDTIAVRMADLRRLSTQVETQ